MMSGDVKMVSLYLNVIRLAHMDYVKLLWLLERDLGQLNLETVVSSFVKNVSLWVRGIVYKSCVWLAVLYGIEVWCLWENMECLCAE